MVSLKGIRIDKGFYTYYPEFPCTPRQGRVPPFLGGQFQNEGPPFLVLSREHGNHSTGGLRLAKCDNVERGQPLFDLYNPQHNQNLCADFAVRFISTSESHVGEK